TVDAGDFAEMVGQRRVQKFSVTARQVTLYLGDVKPGDVKTFEYTLRPKYPIRARTPATVAYEYYTPANRAAAPPFELPVTPRWDGGVMLGRAVRAPGAAGPLVFWESSSRLFGGGMRPRCASWARRGRAWWLVLALAGVVGLGAVAWWWQSAP